MKQLSLSLKLAVASLAIILLLATSLVWRSYSGINQLSSSLEAASEQSLTRTIYGLLQAEALAYSGQMADYLNSAYRLANTLQGLTQESISAIENERSASSEQLSRNELNNIVGSFLRSK